MNDWNSNPSNDWAAEPTQRTFKHDLQGFAFHLAMVALIGSAVGLAWQFEFIPQPVIRVEMQQVQP